MKLSLVLALLALVSSLAAVSLSTPQDSAILGSDIVTFSFSSTTSAVQCSLVIDGSSVKTLSPINANTSYTITHSLPEGSYVWYVSCDTPTIVVSPARDLTIDLQAPIVNLLTPLEGERFSSNELAFVYTPLDSELAECTLLLKIDGAWVEVSSVSNPAPNTPNVFHFDLPDGTYEWNVECRDSIGHARKSLFAKSFTVDTQPPVIVKVAPLSVITENSATLSITTDEKATCRYAASQAVYDSMTPFELSESTTHSQFISTIVDGFNTFYVRCRDTLGNEMDEEKIVLQVHLLPAAQISLSRKTPLSGGTVEVTVKTSRQLVQTPTLTYHYTGGSPVPIPLTGSGSEWKGTMLIEEDDEVKLATFTFSGRDIYGYTGNVITEGKTVLVDTLPPLVPSDVRATVEGGFPIVSWHSDEEDIRIYEVYRSTKAGVATIDFYANTTDTRYVDTLVDNKQTYFYKVLAVDQAGNRGVLSTEVFATSVRDDVEEEPVVEEVKPLPPLLVTKVDDATKEIQALSLSVTQAQASLDALTGSEERFANDLELAQRAVAAQSRLSQLMSGLESLKATFNTDSAIDQEVQKAKLEARKAVNDVVKSLSIEQETEYVQTIQKEDISRATNELVGVLQLTEANKKQFINHNEDIAEDMKINVNAAVIKLEYSDGRTEKNTVFQKSLSYQGEAALSDVIVIETIPKNIAEHVSEITFLGNVPEVVKEDPIVKWGFLELGYDAKIVRYMVHREVSLAQARDVITTPLDSVNSLDASSVTGLSIAPLGTGSVIVALVVISSLGLLGYYYMPLKQKKSISAQLLSDIERKMTSVQVEIDDVLFPLVQHISQSVQEKKEVAAVELAQKLINTGNDAVNRGNLEHARVVYESLSLIYQNLSASEKGRIKDGCIALRSRLE